MTNIEIHKNYCISQEILSLYESWRLPGTEDQQPGLWQYGADDLKRISLILTLLESGFQKEEARQYMLLLTQGKSSSEARLTILNEKRSKMLDELHEKEKKLEHLDYLRYELRKQSEMKEGKQS